MSGRVIGLTLSERQQEYAVDKLAKVSTGRDVEVRLKGWEEFDGTVDRIVSIGAFEHFGHARFAKFIMTEIFPGGRLPSVSMIEDKAADAGFTVARIQMIGPHYVKTLQLWAQALQDHREQAIEAQSQEVYDRYDNYLNGCVRLFREGYTNLGQFTLRK